MRWHLISISSKVILFYWVELSSKWEFLNSKIIEQVIMAVFIRFDSVPYKLWNSFSGWVLII